MRIGHSEFNLQQAGDDGDDVFDVVPRKGGFVAIELVVLGGQEVTFSLDPDDVDEMIEALQNCRAS